MATTRVWALHGNVQKAINYIINPEKTEGGTLVNVRGASADMAGLTWKANEAFHRAAGEERSVNDIVGFHFQQSFPAGSVNADEVMEMATKWIESITDGKNDYVLAVHTDHADRHKNPHIHAHIIVNPRRNDNDAKMRILYKRDLPRFKRLSDIVCTEYGKEILASQANRGKPYYEWMLANKGDTLKDVVAKTIDAVIPMVKDYDEFKAYLERLGYEVQDGMSDVPEDVFDCTADISLFDPDLAERIDIEKYFIRIPKTMDYIAVPMDKGKWVNHDKTYVLRFGLGEQLVRYDRYGNPKAQILGEDLKSYFDDNPETKAPVLKIKPPHSKRFIRCHRIDPNEAGVGYSFNEVIERIENNGRYVSDPAVLAAICSEDKLSASAVNQFYEDANIKTRWINSKWYKMSRRERYINYKRNEIQNRLNAIHDERRVIDDRFMVDDLKRARAELQIELRDVNAEISKEEAYFEQIEIDRLAERLEVSEAELADYTRMNITPLYDAKRDLKKDLSDLSLRISRAEGRNRQAEERANRVAR